MEFSIYQECRILRQELLNEFRERQAKIRPAGEVLLEKAGDAAHGKGEYATYDEIFGSED